MNESDESIEVNGRVRHAVIDDSVGEIFAACTRKVAGDEWMDSLDAPICLLPEKLADLCLMFHESMLMEYQRDIRLLEGPEPDVGEST